jgi:hypothetical protein
MADERVGDGGKDGCCQQYGYCNRQFSSFLFFISGGVNAVPFRPEGNYTTQNDHRTANPYP